MRRNSTAGHTVLGLRLKARNAGADQVPTKLGPTKFGSL